MKIQDINEAIHQIDISGIELVFCEKFDEKSDIWNLEKHKHSYIEIIYFLDGNADVTILEEKMHISLFNMVVYPKERFHQEILDLSKHQEVICMMINSTEFDFDKSMNIPDSNGELLSLMNMIWSEYKRGACSPSLIEHLLKALCIQIVRKANLKGNDEMDIVINYINSHFSEPITIELLADLMYVSKSYFIRRFKSEMDKTPIQYINTLRVEASKRLLATTGMTIEEISDYVGCNSPKYFCRLFKQYTGISPANFKKKI